MADISLDPFVLLPDKVNEDLPCSEQVCWDNPLAKEAAQPLFRSDINVAAIACRKGFRSKKFHYTQIHDLSLHLRGEMSVLLGDARKQYSLKPGDLVYRPPGTTFAFVGNDDSYAHWLYFQINPTPFWAPMAQGGAYIKQYESAPLVYMLLRRILDAHRDRDSSALSEARGDANMLAKVLSRLRNHGPNVVQGPHLAALRQLVSEIGASPGEEWSQARMAQRLHVSARTLLRACQETYELSPQDVVIQVRMLAAGQRLVHTEDTLASIAEQVGYKSVYSFSRIFSKSQGMPPGRYRATRRLMEPDEEMPG